MHFQELRTLYNLLLLLFNLKLRRRTGMAGYDKDLQAFHWLIKKIFSLPDTALSSFIHLTKQRLMWNLKTSSCQRCDDSRKIILPFKVILQSLRRKCFASSDKFHATVFLLLSLVYCVIEQALYKNTLVGFYHLSLLIAAAVRSHGLYNSAHTVDAVRGEKKSPLILHCTIHSPQRQT